MNVKIKDFGIAMELKNRGMELEVKDNSGTHLGDLCIGKGTIEWCKGKTRRGGGNQVSWDDLISWFESR